MRKRPTAMQYQPGTGQLAFSHFVLTPIGLEVTGQPTFPEWEECGTFLRRAEGAVQWWIGDWINYGEKAYGEKYRAAIETTGFEEATLRVYASVARNVEMLIRINSVSFAIHQLVAPLEPNQQVYWLARAANEHLTVAELRQLLRQAQRRLSAAELPAGRFRVLYADPPWAYNDTGSGADGFGRADEHYPTMTIDELCALPVRDHVADDAVLFLWVTCPLLAECWPVIDAWGFQYKTLIVWDKVKHNFGHYVSVRSELLLICTRGSCTPDHPVPMPDSVISIPRLTHSEKPEAFRALIDQLYDGGESQKCELFARRRVPGWTPYGNQVSDVREPAQA